MTIEEQLEELEKIIQQLADSSESSVIVVEGQRDRQTLTELGIRGEIIVLNNGQPILATCEQIASKGKKLILLTDWDKKGGMLARTIRKYVESLGLKCDTQIRADLAKICKKDIKDVQSIGRLLERLRDGKTAPSKPGR